MVESDISRWILTDKVKGLVHGGSLILCVIEVVGLGECQLLDHPPQLSLRVQVVWIMGYQRETF